MNKDRGLMALLLALTLVRGLIYTVLIPPWQAPDEWGHFESSYLVAEWWQLEFTEEELLPELEAEITGSLYEHEAWMQARGFPSPPVMPSEFSSTLMFGAHRTYERPSLAYVLYAAFDWLIHHQDIVVQLYVLRSISVLINVILMWICWSISKEIFAANSLLPTVVMLLAIFHPQHTFMRAVVNDGNLAELATSVIVLILVKSWRRGWNWKSTVTVIASLAVALWSKPTSYFLIAYLPLVAIIYTKHRADSRKTRLVTLLVVTIALLAVYLAPRSVEVRSRLVAISQHLGDPDYMRTWLNWTSEQLLFTWWADLGTQRTNFVDYRLYLLLALFGAVGLTGWVRIVIKKHPRGWLRDSTLSKRQLIVLGLGVMTIGAGSIATNLGNFNLVGRFIFPAFIPTVVTLIAGWAEWIPSKHHKRMGLVLGCMILLLEWWVMATHLIVRYQLA